MAGWVILSAVLNCCRRRVLASRLHTRYSATRRCTGEMQIVRVSSIARCWLSELVTRMQYGCEAGRSDDSTRWSCRSAQDESSHACNSLIRMHAGCAAAPGCHCGHHLQAPARPALRTWPRSVVASWLPFSSISQCMIRHIYLLQLLDRIPCDIDRTSYKPIGHTDRALHEAEQMDLLMQHSICRLPVQDWSQPATCGPVTGMGHTT